jgi:hypothetical protein
MKTYCNANLITFNTSNIILFIYDLLDELNMSSKIKIFKERKAELEV